MWWAFWPGLVILASAGFGPGHEQLRYACNSYVGPGVPAVPCATESLHFEDVRRMSQRSLDKMFIKGAAIERFYWDAPQLDGTTAKADFTVGIAEFDEQGDAWDSDQVGAVKATLSAAIAQRNALVVVFVHGWKNNCESCNGNLKCFRETLALQAATEQRFAQVLSKATGMPVAPREVFGLYIAWRGASAHKEPAKTVSVFSRKATADHIGSSRGGDLTNLLAWVDAQRAREPKQPSPLGNMFAFLGHSFGADVLFGVVANTLDARLAESVGDLSAKPFGDLLVLVNPAFEASAYSRFADAAQKTWKPMQPPVMITVQARNDKATHYALPGSRIITTLGQGSGTRGYAPMITGLGHYEPFYTHDLGPAPNAVPLMQEILTTTVGSAPSTYGGVLEAMASKTPGQPSEKCACDKIRANAPTVKGLWELVQGLAQSSPPGIVHVGDPMPGFASFMQPCRRSNGTPTNVDSPFMMVRASSEIVDGHSGLTQLPFFDFLANFLVRAQVLRDPNLFMAMAAGGMKSSLVLQRPSAVPPTCH